MARSYATWTDLRMLDLRPSIMRSLSAVSSTPKGVTLSRGSHCLQHMSHSYVNYCLTDTMFKVKLKYRAFCLHKHVSIKYQVSLNTHDLRVIRGALHNISVCLKLTTSACCQRKAPGRAFHWSPPVSAPPDGGHLWVGRG